MLAEALSWVLAITLATAPAPAERPRVLVWPQTPAQADELPTQHPRLELVAPDALVAELERARAEASHEEHARLVQIESGLARAREHYLAQAWEQMGAGLAALESERLAELADPRHCDSLWELELRLALAYRGRKQDGDAARAQQKLALALAIAPQRRPARELFGPDVLAEFLVAVDAAAAKVARPIRVTATPTDAQISIDCAALPDDGRVQLRPGLHVLHARAPGYRVHAELFEVPADGREDVVLGAHDEPDPVRRLGLTTADGELPMTASGRRALVEAAAARDLAAVVVVIREGDRFAARALAGAATGAVVRRDALGDAVEAALAQIDDRGHLRAAPGPTRPVVDAAPPPKRPLVKKWWFWTSIVAGVGLAVGLGLGLGLRARPADRFEITVR